VTVALKIALVAFSLALDVFAVAVGVGLRGVSNSLKVRIGLAFAAAEVTMTLVGVGLGLSVGRLLGEVAGYLGFAALFLLGAYMIYESFRESQAPIDMSRGWGLFIASLSISMDSLGIGFSILYIGVPLPVSLVAIGTASVTATAAGLILGQRLGQHAEERAEFWAGVVLAATGIAFTIMKMTGHS